MNDVIKQEKSITCRVYSWCTGRTSTLTFFRHGNHTCIYTCSQLMSMLRQQRNLLTYFVLRHRIGNHVHSLAAPVHAEPCTKCIHIHIQMYIYIHESRHRKRVKHHVWNSTVIIRGLTLPSNYAVEPLHHWCIKKTHRSIFTYVKKMYFRRYI